MVVFFLEQLPLFQIQGALVADPLPREPRMTRWEALMPRGGGGQQMSWRPEFFIWLHRQLIVVEDWPYAGTNFMGDPDIPLPEGEEWEEELGMIFSFYFFMYFHFFCQYMHVLMAVVCICRRGPRATSRLVSYSAEGPTYS